VYRSHDTAGGGDGEEEEEEEEVKGAGRWTKGGRERSEGETSRGEMAGRRKTRHETATEWSSSLTKHQNGTYEAPLLVLTRILFVLVRADGKKEGERERERERERDLTPRRTHELSPECAPVKRRMTVWRMSSVIDTGFSRGTC